MKDETRAAAIRINTMINNHFKTWLETSIFKGLGVNKGIQYPNGISKITAPALFALLQSLHRAFKNCVSIPTVAAALAGRIQSIAGIIPDPILAGIFADQNRTKLAPIDPVMLEKYVNVQDGIDRVKMNSQEMERLKQWLQNQWNVYLNNPRFSVQNTTMNHLNREVSRFYLWLLNTGNATILTDNFVKMFSEGLISKWAGIDKPTITPGPAPRVSGQPAPVDNRPPMNPSPNIPLDIFQSVPKKLQIEVIKPIQRRNTGENAQWRTRELQPLTDRRASILDLWRQQDTEHPPSVGPSRLAARPPGLDLSSRPLSPGMDIETSFLPTGEGSSSSSTSDSSSTLSQGGRLDVVNQFKERAETNLQNQPGLHVITDPIDDKELRRTFSKDVLAGMMDTLGLPSSNIRGQSGRTMATMLSDLITHGFITTRNPVNEASALYMEMKNSGL
jgi:hypothetical protein